MIKIMVVDDEAIFREYLRTSIDWQSYGMEICCEAKNGVEAVEKAQKYYPDIALVDINMPFMDGLTLAEKLRESQPEIGVVLVTGHSEFEYARKAVKLGVADYILKPFEKEELILTLLKIKKNIQKIQQKKVIEEKSVPILKERLLNSLLSRECELNDVEIREQLAYFGIMPQSLLFKIISVEIDNMDEKWDEYSERSLWKYAVSNILQEVVEVCGTHVVFNGPEGRIISLVEFETVESEKVFDMDCYQRLCRLIKQYLDFTITVGVGNTHQGYKGIHFSYMESIVSLQNKFILGNDRVIEYAKIGQKHCNTGFYPTVINEDLLVSMRLNDWEKIRDKLHEVFDYIHLQRLSIDYALAICMGLISLCLAYVTESGFDIEKIFGKGFVPFSEIKKKENMEAVQQWIVDLFWKTLKYTGNARITKARKTAEAAKAYIDENYFNQSLSVEVVAQSVYIHSSYLRTVFKKEIGMTVSEYIAGVRMKKARELLSKGSLKLSEIAQRVGYSDASYFSKCFKKHFGISPSEYENINR